MAEMVVVIPCFNEEKRLDREPIEALLQRAPELRILFVDDGSQDGTRKLLEALVAEIGDGRADLLGLAQNVGKAEAVRQGWITPAVRRGGVVPSRPVAPFESIQADLDEAREDR